MKIGVIQLNSQLDKKANIKTAEENIDELAEKGCDLIVLPEYFNFLGPSDLLKQNAEESNGYTVTKISEKASKLGCYIHLGSILEKVGTNVYNSSFVFNKEGEIIAKYSKIHLFDVNIPGKIVHIESDVISAGKDIVTFNIDGIVFGMVTCYELRFPEIFRRLSYLGASVFIVPSAFHLETGRDHWEVLLRARAIENLSYVIAPDQWKGIPGHICYGRSIAVDPWGVVMAKAQDKVCNFIVEIDKDFIKNTRTNLPALEHRRIDIFPI
jgi:deaminated glutathione amidase